jgi:hypothetical protein
VLRVNKSHAGRFVGTGEFLKYLTVAVAVEDFSLLPI